MNIRAIVFVLSTVALGLFGCESKSENATGAGQTSEVPSISRAPADEKEAGLTSEKMEQAKAKIAPFMDWDEAQKTLTDRLGESTGGEGSTVYWALVEGEKCHELSVERTEEGQVGTTGFLTIDAAMKKQFQKCRERAK